MMSQKNDDCVLPLLMNLGLTRFQATTYTNLTKLGTAGVKAIAKASNAYRSDAYRVMLSLEKLGLAEKIVGDPVMYRATPLREGFDLLMQNKTQEYVDLQREATDTLSSIADSGPNTAPQPEDPQFVICSSEKLFFRYFVDRHENAKKSIDTIGNWRAVSAALVQAYPEVQRTVDRGVKMRIVTEKHKDDKPTQKIIQRLQGSPLFKIRYIPSPVPVEVTTYDGVEVDFCISLALGVPIPSLWSNHPQFLKVMKIYFESVWDKSQDTPAQTEEKLAALTEPNMIQ